MRVISGINKSRRIDVPRTIKARKTKDFEKEKLLKENYNNYIDCEEGVIDREICEGKGSISIELVSRGCDQVIAVERDRDHYQFICKVMKELKTEKCILLRADVFKFVKTCKSQFDFIFADPPYELQDLATIPNLIFENNLLKEDGLFVLEHGKQDHFEDNPHFIEKRVYGSVNFSFFR